MKVSISSITEEKEAAVGFRDDTLFRPIGMEAAQGGELHFFRGRVEGGGDAELLRGGWFGREHRENFLTANPTSPRLRRTGEREWARMKSWWA